MERVILRRELNPYTMEWGFLACFPVDEVNPGMIGAISFSFTDNDMAIFEPYNEIALGYMYMQKIIHKNEPDVEKCLSALREHFGYQFEACERISKK